MTTNFEKLEAVLDANKTTLEEIYKLQSEAAKKKNLIFKAIGDVSETFEAEEDDEHDELTNKLYEISSNLDVVWSGHYDAYDSWEPGERIEFWVPSTC